MSIVAGLFNYWVVIVLMMTGFYVVIARRNLVKKIIGLNIFQVSVFMLYITMGKVSGGIAPIILDPSQMDVGHHVVVTEGEDRGRPADIHRIEEQ